ncbi:MAG: NADH-quinone oxidoreductase subunit J [Anaerolineae bacterium]|nr:MAG: NADH-quinone oxidoreductase subunit J [Anaerolineae bacterium]
MTPMQLIFIFTAVASTVAAIMVVTRRNMVHAALFLVMTLFGVAVAFVLLEAPFLAVVQVVVYIGAIAILMIFAVMLTRNVTDDESGHPFNANVRLALLSAVFVFSLLVVTLGGWAQFSAIAPFANTSGAVAQLGEALAAADGYVLAFEVASMLLLGALVGAIFVVWPRQAEND